jgi:hypothetical protein
MQSTNQKGAIAETMIAARAVQLGIEVLRPVGEGGRYDLAFDVGDRILRVQCKWATVRGDVVLVRCFTNRRGPNGQIRSYYSADEIDLLAAYCAELDKCYVLPAAMVAGRRTFHLRLRPAKNNQKLAILWAAQYEFGAVAQLGERLAGSQKVRGSSPLSSTS